MYQESEKFREYLAKYGDLRAIVAGNMCKGINPETIAKSSLAHMQNALPPDLHTLAFATFGKNVSFPEVDLWGDSSDDYAQKMVDSGKWEQIELDPKYYKEQLRDHDVLTWAFSTDGLSGCNDKAGLNGGNTTTGFLIDASGEFPTLAYAVCSYIPSGVFPLAEALSNQERFGSGLKSRLLYAHRWIG